MKIPFTPWKDSKGKAFPIACYEILRSYKYSLQALRFILLLPVWILIIEYQLYDNYGYISQCNFEMFVNDNHKS